MVRHCIVTVQVVITGIVGFTMHNLMGNKPRRGSDTAVSHCIITVVIRGLVGVTTTKWETRQDRDLA